MKHCFYTRKKGVLYISTAFGNSEEVEHYYVVRARPMMIVWQTVDYA